MKTTTVELEKGRTVKSVHVEDGQVRVEYNEPEEWTPESGDVVEVAGMDGQRFFGIYNEKGYPLHFAIINGKVISPCTFSSSTRLLTYADRCIFFETLNAAGYKWNAKKLLLTKKEEKKWEPKEGDFVTCEKNTQGNMWFIIWGEKTDTDYIHEKFGYSPSGKNISVGCCCGVVDTFRPTHDSEKQVLLTVLKKEGKRWNAEKKCVENIPCPPKIGLKRTIGEIYWFLDSKGNVSCACDRVDAEDDERFDLGNYFHTCVEAMEFFEKEIKPVYKKRK